MKMALLFLILSLTLLLTGCAETAPEETKEETGLESDLGQLDEEVDLDEMEGIEEDINSFDW